MALKIKGGQVKSAKALKASLKKGGAGGEHYMTRVPKDDSLTVRFMTEPTEWFEYTEYFKEDVGYFPAVEGIDPDFVEGLDRPSKKFLAAAIDVDDNKVLALVLTKTLAADVNRMYEKYGTITDRDYELSKEGTGFQTEYTAIPEAPSRMRIDRFEEPDLMACLEAAVPAELQDDDDDDDSDNLAGGDDTPIRKPKRRPRPDPDEDDEPAPRRRSKPSTSSSAAKPGLKTRPRPKSAGLKRK